MFKFNKLKEALYLFVVVAAVLAFTSKIASGATARSSSPPYADQVKSADFIFEGKVTRIEYRLDEANNLPYTYVTYNINKILKGKSTGPTLTLRFLGGRGKKSDFLMVEGVPLFDLDDNDIILVKGNGTSICPLVNCSNGRYRLVDGYVHNEEGYRYNFKTTLMLPRQAPTLQLGPRIDRPEFTTHKVSQTILKKHIATPQEQKDSEEGQLHVQIPPIVLNPLLLGSPATIQQFKDFSIATITRLHTPVELNRLMPVKDIKIQDTLPITPFKMVPSPIISATKLPVRIHQPTPFDLEEERLLKQNQGNPVITTPIPTQLQVIPTAPRPLIDPSRPMSVEPIRPVVPPVRRVTGH